MVDTLRHRGPDGVGFHDDGDITLGHCRLAIIDLEESGAQPMVDASGRYWVTYNGEIYNYVELRKTLAGRGHRFRGESDTEVLLAAFVEWGAGCVDHLRGMFAFAIGDTVERSLFAARDRLGIKPFYYVEPGLGRFAFASEVKALLPLVEARRVNGSLARDYLAWNLLGHVADQAFVQGVSQLGPATTLTWRPGQGVRLRSYWGVSVATRLASTDGEREASGRQFRELVEDTVDCHLRADVPIGTCLSGGLDSSTLVVVARERLERKGRWTPEWQHTFTARFDEPELDEQAFVDSVVGATGCSSHTVAPSGERLRDEIQTWLWHLDEPVGGTNAYAQYCVARLARENGVKVLLDGQGADEQLAGYRKFIVVYLRQLVAEGRPARAAAEAMRFLSPSILRTTRLVEGLRYFGKGSGAMVSLFGGELPSRPEDLGLGRSLGRRLEADLLRHSLPVLLRYEDRNTMAHGIEARVPFVDHVMVEWLAQLPGDLRLSGGWTKRVLREAMVGLLPEKVRMRKSKLGFSTPEDRWLRGPLKGWLCEALERPRHLADVVDSGAVRALGDRVRRDRVSAVERRLAFRLAAYETWADMFLGTGGSPVSP